MKRASTYIFIAGATLGSPLALELSGGSRAFAQEENRTQREAYVNMLDSPLYEREDVQRNIDYMDRYKVLRGESARWGANAFALLFGLGASSSSIVLKRKLEKIMVPDPDNFNTY